MPPHPSLQHSESQARRSSALESALGPIADFLADERVVEVMLNADGAVWIERHGQGMLRTAVRMAGAESDRMLRLVAAEMLVELNAQRPSLSAKLPPPWSARLQASIPPIVDAPVFALRKPASVVFSLDDYVKRRILSPSQRDALATAVHAHDNILIGGGTGSGKTTFANVLLKVIAEETTERANDHQTRSIALEMRVAEFVRTTRELSSENTKELRKLRLEILVTETQCDALDELCRSLLLTLESAVDRDADASGDSHPDGQARVAAS